MSLHASWSGWSLNLDDLCLPSTGRPTPSPSLQSLNLCGRRSSFTTAPDHSGKVHVKKETSSRPPRYSQQVTSSHPPPLSSDSARRSSQNASASQPIHNTRQRRNTVGAIQVSEAQFNTRTPLYDPPESAEIYTAGIPVPDSVYEGLYYSRPHGMYSDGLRFSATISFDGFAFMFAYSYGCVYVCLCVCAHVC